MRGYYTLLYKFLYYTCTLGMPRFAREPDGPEASRRRASAAFTWAAWEDRQRTYTDNRILFEIVQYGSLKFIDIHLKEDEPAVPERRCSSESVGMSVVSRVVGTENLLSATASTFRDRTQTPKSPESSHSENWDQMAALMAWNPEEALLVSIETVDRKSSMGLRGDICTYMIHENLCHLMLFV